MDYTRIRDLFKKESISDTQAEIVSCVNSSMNKMSDEEFNLICSYVESCWYAMDNSYFQLLTDIICDLYQNLEYGYRDEEKDKVLTLEDLKNKEKIDMVLDLFYDRY